MREELKYNLKTVKNWIQARRPLDDKEIEIVSNVLSEAVLTITGLEFIANSQKQKLKELQKEMR